MAEFDWVYRPENAECIMILIGDHGEAAQAASLLVDLPCAVVCIPCRDWNLDLSPWPAPAVFGKEDFGGGADAFLRQLLDACIPSIQQEATSVYGGCSLSLGICGYSLAGLFALWAAMRCDRFRFVASVSGSLWYDGFEDWFAEHASQLQVERAYFSVGDKEKRTRNLRMACVEDASRGIAEKMALLGIQSTFELNPGNHFQQVPERLSKAIHWLMLKE